MVLFAAAVMTVLLFFPGICTEGIKKGMGYTVRIIVPSLFPYMVLSSFIVRSGTDIIIGRISVPLTKLLALPESAGAAVLLSLTGGFPVGAKCVSLLYEESRLNKEQADRMMCFCVCPGPAFLITALGCIMLGNIQAGIIVCLSQILSSLIIGTALGMIFRFTDKSVKFDKVSVNIKTTDIISCITGAVTDGAESIINMSAMIIFFSVFENAFRSLTAFLTGGDSGSMISAVTASFLEVTGGCQAVKDSALPLYFFSVCVGFGGMCVHFQIFGVLENVPVSRMKYLIFRFVNAVLSGAVTWIICIFYIPAEVTAVVGGGYSAFISERTAAGSIALLFMSVVFVLSIQGMRRGKEFYVRNSGLV